MGAIETSRSELRRSRRPARRVLRISCLVALLLGCSGDLAARLEAREQQNPIPYGPESLARGRALYGEHCQRCHGPTGRGDGPDAAALEGGAGNLAERGAILREGSIAYKSRHGQERMPAFRDSLSRDEIWDLTNYVKSLPPEG